MFPVMSAEDGEKGQAVRYNVNTVFTFTYSLLMRMGVDQLYIHTWYLKSLIIVYMNLFLDRFSLPETGTS